MRDKLNCPNCGTIFYDFANIEIGKEAALRLKIGDNLAMFKAVAEHIEIRNIPMSRIFFCDDRPVTILDRPDEYELTLTLRVVPNERDVLFTKIKQPKNK